jgi:NTP pyrophosphatase (non-canonical NTP hydrolase)
MALSLEVAEIAEHFQWLTEDQSKILPSEKLAEVKEEIGDVMTRSLWGTKVIFGGQEDQVW